MSNFEHINENGESEWNIPSIDIEVNGGETVALNWFNCRVRTYADPQYNHVEFLYGDGGLGAFTLTEEAYMQFVELEFPRAFDPVPDESTEKWLRDVLTKRLDSEIKDFFDGTSPE